MDEMDLIEEARDAKQKAYCPYSSYPVGAAVETSDGEIYHGANLENANYTRTMHAEEAAVATAYFQKGKFEDLERLAISSDGNVPPCGGCRQFLAEFFEEDFKILVDGDENSPYTTSELLPGAMEEI